MNEAVISNSGRDRFLQKDIPFGIASAPPIQCLRDGLNRFASRCTSVRPENTSTTSMINQKGDTVAQNYFRFLQGFMDYTDSDLVAMAAAVIAGLSGNKAFPSPLVELPAFQAALADFTAAIIATAQGGITATADTNDKRAVEDLGEEAAYVQAHCDDNLNTL